MLKGLGGLGDMAKIMKQAQEMQSKMTEAQDALEQIMVEGESGAGLVRATATAKGELKGLDIDASILAAIRDAQEKAQAKSAEAMGSLTEGMGLPPGMKFPF